MFVLQFRVISKTQLRNSERKRLKARLLKEFPKLTDADVDVLVPEGDAVVLVKIITFGGEEAMLYLVEKTPLMFEIDDVLFPSVYMLWRVPTVLPALTVWPELCDKIMEDAKLKLSQVVVKEPLHPKSYGSFKYGNSITINTVDNKAPFAIGSAALSNFDMYRASQREIAVRIVHTVGDKLWEFGLNTEIPKLGPPHGYDDESGSSTSGTQTENGSDSSKYYARYSGFRTESSENEESDEEESDGSLPPENDETTGADVAAESSVEHLKGLKPAKTYCIFDEAAGTGLSYAVSPVLDLYDPNIHRETSTRMTDRDTLLEESDESLISDDLRSLKLVESSGAARPLIIEMYNVTSAVLPVLSAFGFRKGDMVTISDLRKYVTEYVKKEKLQDPIDKRMVNVNKELQKLVKDPNTIAVPWEDLMDLFVNHMTASYKMNNNGQKSVAHKGELEPIDIQISRNIRNKKVTLVNNLELYGINLREFARQCQHGVASASIAAVPGKKSHQLLVQGNKVAFIGSLLTRWLVQGRHTLNVSSKLSSEP